MTLPQLAFIALDVVGVTAVFAAGIWVGARAFAPDPPPAVVTYVTRGDYADVPMVMRSSMGVSFRYLCDLHLDEDPTAECEYRDPEG